MADANSKDVVAILLHFRTAQLTLRCLQSLREAGVGTVVMVDNSQDSSTSLASMRDPLEEMRRSGFHIEVLCPQRNLGFAAGVNFALARVLAKRSARILLINSDAVMDRKALEVMNSALLEGFDVVAPALVGETNTNSGPAGYQKWLGLIVSPRVPGAFAYLSGACLLISERVVRPKLFDEDFFFYGEDVELSHRLRSEGARLCRLPAVRVVHPPSGSARNGSMFYEYHVLRGHWQLATKLTGNPLCCAAAIAGRLLTMPVRALWRAISARSMTPLRAFGYATFDIMRGRMRDLTPPLTSSRSDVGS